MEFSCEMVRRVSNIDPREALVWVEDLGYEISVIDKQSHEAVTTTADQLVNAWGSLSRIEDLLLTPR
jgi:hypothetical protein